MRVLPLALSDENTMAEFKVPVINGKTIASRGTLNTSYKEKGEEKSYTEKVKVINSTNGPLWNISTDLILSKLMLKAMK
jgi:hypothetical protein